MISKLTLTIEKEVIDRSKIYAKKTGRSLSEIIENYLNTITEESENDQISPKLKKLVGVVNLPEDFNEKAELQAAIEMKHL
jgi:hypothetical protein